MNKLFTFVIASLVLCFVMPAMVSAQNASPHSLTAETAYSQIMLNWKAPAASKTLQWHNDNAYNGKDAVANDPQGMASIYAANRFTSDDLKGVDGEVIKSIGYMQYYPMYSVIVQIYENNKLVYEQPSDMKDFERNKIKEVVLTTPYTIHADVDIMIVAKFICGTNISSAAIFDKQAPENGKGDLYSYDGKSWMHNNQGNFVVTAYLKNDATAVPDGYNVYRDGVKVNTEVITANEYLLENEPDGTHKYAISAIYGTEELKSTEIEATAKSLTQYFPSISNLSANVSELECTLAWDSPLLGGKELTWSNKAYGNSIGGTASTATKVWVKNSFDPSDLLAFTNNKITAINIFFKVATISGGTIFVMKDGVLDYTQTLTSDDISSIKADDWNKFGLATPYTIEIGHEYAYGVYVLHTKSTKPIGVDNSAGTSKGNMFSITTPKTDFKQTNPSWKTLASGNIPGNWLMTADLETESTPLVVDHYEIYRNGTKIESDIKTQSYVDNVNELGICRYSVVAVGANGNSSEAIKTKVSFDLPAAYRAPLISNSDYDKATKKVSFDWNMDVELKHYGDPAYIIGFDEDISLLYGARFSAEELKAYSGYKISKFRFAIGAPVASLKLQVYTPDGTMLASQDIDATQIEPLSLYTIDLDNPINIPSGTDIIICYNTALVGGTTPILLDGGPAIENGAVISISNGTNWMKFGSIYTTYKNYNIVLSAIATDASGKTKSMEIGDNPKFDVMNSNLLSARKCAEYNYGIEASDIQTKATVAAPTVDKFRVYCNGEVVSETKEMKYVSNPLVPGEYNLYVTTLYSNGWESPASEVIYINEEINQNTPAPYNLEGKDAANGSLALTWEVPEASEKLTYASGDQSYGIGMTGSTTLKSYIAIKYPADQIVDKVGESITHIKFGLLTTDLKSASVIVYYGDSKAFEQPVDVATLKVGENTIRLNRQVTIPEGIDIMIGYYITYASGLKPMMTDAGPAIDGFGNLLSASAGSGSWKTLKSMNASLDYNWRITGVISKPNGKASEKGKSIIKEETDPITYNVYRNGVIVKSGITELSVMFESALNGIYTVTASQGGIESAHSNSVEFLGQSGASLNDASSNKIFYSVATTTVVLPQSVDAVIYSSTGSIVKESKESATVNVSDLPAGIYIVRCEGNQTLKFVKQ